MEILQRNCAALVNGEVQWSLVTENEFQEKGDWVHFGQIFIPFILFIRADRQNEIQLLINCTYYLHTQL